MNIEKAIEEFKNYTSKYIGYGEMINLKIYHTFRVVDLCERIAKSLDLTEEEINVAKMIGLLHDIGRFEQWKVYGTFRDLESIDHADFGVEVLTKDNYIRKYISDDKYDEIILNSIKYHNKYAVPENINEKEKMFAKLIRDADKIDILYLYIKGELKVNLDDSSMTESIYNTLINNKGIDRKNIKTLADRVASVLGFIFDVNYNESFKYLKEVKYLDTIIDIYKEKTTNERLKEQLEETRKTINNYIEVNLC